MTTTSSATANTAPAKLRILCVDDEPNVLEGLGLHLRRKFDMTTAPSGAAALALLEGGLTPAVIVSDMRMPQMNGAQFLAAARRLQPDAVRMLLTGQADVQSSIAAVNEGQVFRFLTKPCAPADLLAAVEAAAGHHRLITAEKVLLEQTLRGCIRALVDVLSLASPSAFGRANRLKAHAIALIAAGGGPPSWQIEIAAMLSQLGSITLPAALVERLYEGKTLGPDEEALVERLPAASEQFITDIPRMEEVRAIVLHQARRFDGSGSPRSVTGTGAQIPLGARVLKIVSDYDVLEAQGKLAREALDVMAGRAGWYDAELLARFAQVVVGSEDGSIQEVGLRGLVQGMVFTEDVRTQSGVLLVVRGHEVTESLIERFKNFPPRQIPDRLRVKVGRPR